MPNIEKAVTGTDGIDGKSVNGLTLQSAIGKISDAAAPAASYITSGAHLAGEALVSAAARANEALGTAGEQLHTFQERTAEDCRSYVRAKPITAIGLALAAGFLFNALLSRNSDK